MTTISGGQVRRLRLPAALLTAALIAAPALASPAFADTSAAETTTVTASAAGVEPGAASEPDPATAPAEPAAPVSGESFQQVALSGVDEKAAASEGAREEATAPTPQDLSDAGVAAVEPDPTDDDQLAALSAERTTKEFTAAGLTWTPDANDKVIEAAVRVREDGEWSEWNSLEVLNPGSEGEGSTAGTEPVLSLGANGIQARVLTTSGQTPANLKINLIAAGTSPTDGQLRAAVPSSAAVLSSADGAALKPGVITRKQWKADEGLANTTTRRSAKLQAMYVHHTASKNNYTEAEAAAQVRSIYEYHTRSLKWDDIGYQFIVDRFGNIYEGRRGAINDLIVGAQAGGYNANTIGVSALGNYQENKPSAAMVEALTKVLAWKGYQYNLNVAGTTTMTTTTAGASTASAKNGVKVTVPVILGHRNTNNTSCPGQYLYAKLGSIRTEVSKRIASATSKYGKAHALLKAPAASGNYSSDSPVSKDGKITLSWKPVDKATKYQVMVGSVSDSRIWWAGRTTTATSTGVTIAAGESAVFGIRAMDGAGRVSSTTRLVQSSRPKAVIVTQNLTRWTTDSLNLRKSADVGSDLLLKIPAGTKITVTATSGNWSRTTYSGKTGWVSSSYLSSAPKPVGKLYRYTALDTRLLKSASSAAAKVVSVSKNEKLELVKTSGGWSNVKLGSKAGWISSSKLSSAAPKGKQYRYTALDTRLLKSASSGAAKVVSVSKSEKLELLKTSNGWSNVKLGSKTGWIASSKLSTSAPKGKQYRKANLDTRLLKSASDKAAKVVSVSKGKKLELVRTSNGWSNVKLGSKAGWIKSSKLSTTSSKGR